MASNRLEVLEASVPSCLVIVVHQRTIFVLAPTMCWQEDEEDLFGSPTAHEAVLLSVCMRCV